MWEGSHTDLLSGKSMFIDMHDIDSPDKSAFSFTVYTDINIHEVDDVAQTYIIDDARHTRSGAKKGIIKTTAFLNS